MDALMQKCYNSTNHIRKGRALLEAAPTVSQRSDIPMTTPIVPASPDSDNLKRCAKCGQFKPRAEFRRSSTTKDGCQAWCLPCAREYDRQHYANTKDHQIERGRIYREANREEMRARDRARYIADAEKQRERKRAYYAANPDKEAARHRRYYTANIDRVRAYSREYNRKYYAEHREKLLEDNCQWRASPEGLAYYAANRQRTQDRLRRHGQTPTGKDVLLASKHRRRARIAGVSNSPVTTADIQSIRAAQTDKKGRLICWRCGKPIKGTPHLDHFIPIAKGGAHTPGNLHFMHAKCNLTKSSKHPHELGMLI